jgi:formylglycine-generating enzyme required for sulfatase activity
MVACSGTSTPTTISAGTPIPAGIVPDWKPIAGSINDIPVVYVPAGCFMMGSTDEEVDEVYEMCQALSLRYLGEDRCDRGFFEVEQPLHEVCLSSFWIGQTEVTNAQYAQCVKADECSPPSDQEFFGDPDYADHPVVFVDWGQARKYAEWVGGDLPTEAQWAYAARGPMRWTYPWGNAFDGSRLNFCDVNCPEFPNEEWDDGFEYTSPSHKSKKGGKALE